MNRESELQKAGEAGDTKRGLRNAERFKENPFLKGATVEIRGKKRFYNVLASTEAVVDLPTGEIKGTVEHKLVKIVDDAEFVKVFADGVAGMYDLGRPGRRVLSYLLEVIQAHPNTDRIYLHFMDALEEPWGISKATFFRGMGELATKRFIAPAATSNMFFLNPCMVWNGDRFRFITEYTRASSKLLADGSQRAIADAIEEKPGKLSQAELEARGQQRLPLPADPADQPTPAPV